MKKLRRVSNFNILIYSIIFILISSCKDSSNKADCNEVFQNHSNKDLYIKFCENLESNFDFESGIKKAKENEKLVFVYFNSIACTNCRSFENDILFNPEIKKSIKNNFISTVLFVDSREKIEVDDKYPISKFSNKEIKTKGAYNVELQLIHIGNSHQPTISIFNEQGKLVSTYSEKSRSTKSFQDWLNNIIDTKK